MLLTLAFPAGRGVDWWTQRNAASPIPGRWPYGLDALSTVAGHQESVEVGSIEVEAVEVAPLGRLTRQLSLRTGRRPRSAGSTLDRVAACWDESLAPAMLNRVSAERRFAGVIWATDRVAAQGESPETRLIKESLLQLDGLWVLSRPQLEAVRAWLGPRCPPVHYLTFGVDPDFYRAAPYPELSSPSKSTPTTTPTVVSIGGDRDRDPETLFVALERVLRQRPEVTCLVQTRSDRTAPAGVRTEAFIPHDQVRRLYAGASVVALATGENLHGSGMTVSLEAMSVGRPVVATGTPGMEDYVTEGVTGHLVPPSDPAAMADRILALLEDPARAAEMGENGRRSVVEKHTTLTMGIELLRIVGA